MNKFQPDNLVRLIVKYEKSRLRIYTKRYKLLTEEEKNVCQPLPCEDILQELGWKRNGGGTLYHTEIDGYYLHWSGNEQLRFLLKMKHPEKDDFVHIHNVRYIHQLQNIVETFTGIKLPNVDMLIKG